MKLQITRATCRCCSSTASPWPWLPQLLLMMVRALTRRRPTPAVEGSASPNSASPPAVSVMRWRSPASASAAPLLTFGFMAAAGGRQRLPEEAERGPQLRLGDDQGRGDERRAFALVQVD